MRYVVLLLILLSCKQNKGPEDSLRDYIKYTVSGSVTKQGFLDRSAGTLYTQLEMMNNEDFESYASEMSHVDKNKIRVNSSNCEQDRCSITYTVFYKAKSSEVEIYDIEVRKNAEMLRIDDEWKLSSITNLKSHYDGVDITDQDFKNQNNGLSPEEVDELRR